MSKPDLIAEQCIRALESIHEDDSLFGIARELRDAWLDSNGAFTTVERDVDPRSLLPGLESRLRAKGAERGQKIGLVQTVERLNLAEGKVHLVSANTPHKRAMLYLDQRSGTVLGLTVSG